MKVRVHADGVRIALQYKSSPGLPFSTSSVDADFARTMQPGNVFVNVHSNASEYLEHDSRNSSLTRVHRAKDSRAVRRCVTGKHHVGTKIFTRV